MAKAAGAIRDRWRVEVLAVPADITRSEDVTRVVRETLANMIVFLASERARYVTGVTVQVDGGLVRSML